MSTTLGVRPYFKIVFLITANKVMTMWQQRLCCTYGHLKTLPANCSNRKIQQTSCNRPGFPYTRVKILDEYFPSAFRELSGRFVIYFFTRAVEAVGS